MQPRYTPSRPWAPLSQAELTALAPFFAQKGAGRPIFDIRARLDAIFWAVTPNGYWKDLPPHMGPADTAHRQFRRWVHKGVWTRLLQAVATSKDPVLLGLKHWLCRAFRRALRILGTAGYRLARRLGLTSALPGPPWMCPDPDLSDTLQPAICAALRESLDRRGLPSRDAIQAAIAFHKLVGGARYIPKYLAPP
jgi:transposase